MGILYKVFVVYSFLYLSASNSFADANWPNEPNGSTVILDCPFNNTTCDGRLRDEYNSTGSTLNVVNDPSAPLSPGNVFRSSLYYPNSSGGSQVGFYFQEVKEVYAGFWWRTNPEYSGNMVGMNKMFFVRGPSLNGYFGIGKTDNPKVFNFFFGHNTGGGLDNSHTCSLELGLACFPNAGDSSITVGQWTRIEVYFKASTSRTSRDGTVRWWVNGRLAGNFTNMNYGPTLNDWTWAETWDGETGRNGKGFTADAHHFIDHLHVSVPNGGNIPIPMPQPQPQPQPGPQPAPQPAPQPVPQPSLGSVNDLSVVSVASSSVNLSFTEINDGAGAPAKYDLRYGPAGSNWGAMSSVSAGSCATPIIGSQIGAKKNCTISGLTASTQYQFQIVAFSGTMNQGAVYGGLSSVASATTSAGSNPQPQPQPQPSNGAPVVQFTFPNVGAVLSDQVFVYAQVGSSVAISEVRFFVDGLQVGPELKQAPYSLLLDTHRISNGAHQISAIAKDISGVSSVAAKVDVIVSNSNGGSAAYDPLTAAAGCVMGQTKTNQINASMSLIWLLPLAGLMRRRKKE